MIDGIRLDNYLNSIDISRNEYFKALIKTDLDSKGINYPCIDSTTNTDAE